MEDKTLKSVIKDALDKDNLTDDDRKQVRRAIRDHLMASGKTELVLDVLIFACMILCAVFEEPYALAIFCTLYITCNAARIHRRAANSHAEGILVLKVINNDKPFDPEEETK